MHSSRDTDTAARFGLQCGVVCVFRRADLALFHLRFIFMLNRIILIQYFRNPPHRGYMHPLYMHTCPRPEPLSPHLQYRCFQLLSPFTCLYFALSFLMSIKLYVYTWAEDVIALKARTFISLQCIVSLHHTLTRLGSVRINESILPYLLNV